MRPKSFSGQWPLQAKFPTFFDGVAFHTLVRRLAFHAKSEKTGRYVSQKMHGVLNELESKRPVRKSQLSCIVMMAYANLVFMVNGEFITNLKDAKEYPTYSALTARVKEIMGITTHDEKLERNVRFIADDIGLPMTFWKGSKPLQ